MRDNYNSSWGSVWCITLVYVIHNQNAQVLSMDINVMPQPFTNEQIQKLPSLAAKYGMEIRPNWMLLLVVQQTFQGYFYLRYKFHD